MNLPVSINKSVNHCAILVIRSTHTESATFGKLNRAATTFKMSIRSHIRNIPVSQWKLLNQFKEYAAKATGENGAFFVLNKEWLALLQKFPTIHEKGDTGTTVDKATVKKTNGNSVYTAVDIPFDQNSPNKTTKQIPVPTKLSSSDPKLDVGIRQPYGLPQVLSGLGFTGNKESAPEEIPAQWKEKKNKISKTSISSRVKHIIMSIAHAESTQSKIKRLRDLNEHLDEYPESKNLAVKAGAIRVLLRLRHENENDAVLPVLREAFARLGHIEPLPGRGIRILSIDGGGIRGVLAIEMLKKLEQITGKKVYELFDYVCGVSTGAILAANIAVQMKDLDEVSVLYKDLSTKIFTQSTFWGTSNLVWTHAYYDTEIWEDILKTHVGELSLIKTSRDPRIPKVSAVSTVVNKARVLAYLFRNYSLPHRTQSQYMGSHHHQTWEAVRASAAAPLYFEEFKLGDLLHQDGGILVNNPTAVALHEARQLWPTSPIQCIVSLGTGRFTPSHTFTENVNSTNMSSWKTKFLKILDSATDTEAVHTMLNDLMPPTVYHRFNPYITEMVNMDEISPDKITQLETDAAMYYRRNEDKFEAIAKALLAKRTVFQHLEDWTILQRQLLGFN